MYYNKKFEQNFEKQIIKIHKLNQKMLCDQRELYLQRNRVVQMFIKDNSENIIIHGSRALNFYKKIYEKEKLIGVDFDLYVNGEMLKGMVDNLVKFLETYKITGIKVKFVEQNQVYQIDWKGKDFVDMKYMDSVFFKSEPYKTDPKTGLKYLNYDILKMSLYKQSVISEQFRWSKAYFQFGNYDKLLYDKEPVVRSRNNGKSKNKEVLALLLGKYVNGNKNIILMGNLCYYNYSNAMSYLPPITYIDLGCYEPLKEIEKIKKILNVGENVEIKGGGNENIKENKTVRSESETKGVEVVKFNNIIEGYPIYCIKVKGEPVVYLHEITMCISVKKWNNNYYTDIFKLFTYYVITQYLRKLYKGMFQDSSISARCLYEIERKCDMRNMFEYLDCFGNGWNNAKLPENRFNVSLEVL